MSVDLTIDRIEIALAPLDAPQLRRATEVLVDRGLERASRHRALPSGEWCIRRVPVRVKRLQGRTDTGVADEWAEAVLDAIVECAQAGGQDVVYFQTIRAALVDLVSAAATGRLSNRWAWEQLELVDSATSSEPRQLILHALTRNRDFAPSVLCDAIVRVGFTALDHALGTQGWYAVAAAVLGIDRLDDESAVSTGAAPPRRYGMSDARHQSMLAASPVVHAFVRSGLRPTGARTVAIAALTIASAEPAALISAGAVEVVRVLARCLTVNPPTERDAPTTDPAILGAATGHVATAFGSSPAPEPAVPEGEYDDQRVGRHSEWGGLLFVLNLLNRLPVEEYVSADPCLSNRSLRWTLFHLAAELGPVDSDDPARHAFAGLDPRGLRDPDGEPSPDERVALGRLADVLEGLALDAGVELASAIQRSAVVFLERGWIEAHYSLDSVDVALRSAGLDFDPGWLPWLGAVVRFGYE